MREQQREREEFNKLLSAMMEPSKREREEPERAAIREAWDESEDGKGFAAALKERGFTLAQSEHRDFVAVDERGSVYGIDQRTKGGQAVDVREKLADLDNEYVPTVEEVRWQQREHEREPERADTAPALDIVPGKGAARVLGAALDAPANVIGGIVDFFVGSPPPEKPKEPERPRTKTIAERDAEDRAEKQAELDRRRAMTEEERKEERERLRERERERERGRER